jgi:hypothetical protein
VRLGKFVHPHVHVLECSDDGAIVVAAASCNAMAWDAEARKLLWHRSDLEITSGCFTPGGGRLIVGLDTGQIVELDPLSGVEIDRLTRHAGHVASIAIAPQGNCLASVDWHGNLLVTALQTDGLRPASPRWSKRCSKSALRTRFSPDGRALAVPHPSATEDLGLYCALSGERLYALSGTEGVIGGVEISASGIVYAWKGGDILAWNPIGESGVRRLTPARDWGPVARKRYESAAAVLACSGGWQPLQGAPSRRLPFDPCRR